MKKNHQNKTSIHVGEFLDSTIFFKPREAGTAKASYLRRQSTVTNSTAENPATKAQRFSPKAGNKNGPVFGNN